MKRTYTGIVTKISGSKTKRVEYTYTFIHKLYKKTIVHKKHQLAHDELSSAKIGDTVLIQECRPISKNKSFFIKQIIKAA